MYVRLLLTAASLTVASLAVLVVDCSSSSVRIVTGDPIGACATLNSLGVRDGLWIGVGLISGAILALVAVWAVRPGTKRRSLEPVNSLKHNLGRLADFGSELEQVDENTPSGVHMNRLVRRLEAVELSLSSEVTPAREATQQWMSLLREANDLHNEGELATDHFKEINTRLLSLFTIPSNDADELASSASR
jgi:hypothetical protein